jgi:hemolysin activation/secretion protein
VLVTAAFPLLARAVPDAGSLLQQIEARPGGALSAPKLLIPQEPTPPVSEEEEGAVVQVKAFRIEGATLVESDRLQQALAGFVQRDLSLTQLQEAAWVVVETYKQAGWLAHAYLPPQEIEGGVVTLQVVEAKLGQVQLKYPSEDRLPHALIDGMAEAQLPRGEWVDLKAVDRLLLLLSDIPGVQATASFTEGQEAGHTDLLLVVNEGKALDVNLSQDNFGAVSTGVARTSVNLSFNNLAGLGDGLQLQTLRTLGSHYARLAYSLPVGWQGWRVGLHGSDMRYELLGSFANLQASGAAQTWGVDLSVPLIRQPEQNLSWQVSSDRKRFDNLALATTADTQPSTTSQYMLDVWHSGLVGNWVDDWFSSAQNSASVQASWGRVDLSESPNATADASAANTAGFYRKLSANFSREQSLTVESSWYLQLGGQWANRNLDSSEKLYLGGATGVRAYPSNEAGGSLGATATTGFRQRLDGFFTLNEFVDWGRVEVYRNNLNAAGTALTPLNAYSLKGHGLQLAWKNPEGSPEFSLTWSRRDGGNPAANASTGADSDGTFRLNRAWLSATLNF